MKNDTDTLRHVTLELDIQGQSITFGTRIPTRTQETGDVSARAPRPYSPPPARQTTGPPPTSARRRGSIDAAENGRLVKGDRARGTATRSEKRASVRVGAHSRQAAV